jgi:AcrR family transcriptional regulator
MAQSVRRPIPWASADGGERSRTRRGEGSRLRDEILASAAGLLQEGAPGAITLSALARDVGIATTSIYSHFADRDEILDALDGRTFEEMAEPAERAMGQRRVDNLFHGIEACVEQGASDSEDPFADALAVWSALHGYATLRANLQTVPWPHEEQAVPHLVTGLARLRRPESEK